MPRSPPHLPGATCSNSWNRHISRHGSRSDRCTPRPPSGNTFFNTGVPTTLASTAASSAAALLVNAGGENPPVIFHLRGFLRVLGETPSVNQVFLRSRPPWKGCRERRGRDRIPRSDLAKAAPPFARHQEVAKPRVTIEVSAIILGSVGVPVPLPQATPFLPSRHAVRSQRNVRSRIAASCAASGGRGDGEIVPVSADPVCRSPATSTRPPCAGGHVHR